MTDDALPQPVVTGIPIVTAPDGQALVGADWVVVYLHALAEACRNNVHDAEEAEAFAAAIDIEADALACRAIAHTT